MAIVQQAAVLSDAGTPWGRASFRSPTGRAGTRCRPGSRCTAGSSARRRRRRRLDPSSSSTAPTERAARRDPTCPPKRSIVCAAPAANSASASGTARSCSGASCGPCRTASSSSRFPAPAFLQRLLAAVLLLLPAAGGLYLLGGVIVLVRAAGARRSLRELLPPGARTFRGRLVALFVLTVMVPLLAVTFFLRASITARSRQDTIAHARTGLETARRVLDDYLPSAPAARGRLGLIDDALLSWLANAVGFDLSVYSPEATLAATSRRDLYAAGLLPERCPGLELRGRRPRRSPGDDRRAHPRREALRGAHDGARRPSPACRESAAPSCSRSFCSRSNGRRRPKPRSSRPR